MMDSSPPGIPDKRLLCNGPSFRRSPTARPDNLVHSYTTITIHKDERGYGMKVSGDNPVYVQSVKEGGAAERAGLHSGDTIVKVNGVNVLHLTHTEVVELIKAASQVVLTVQQNPLRERSSSNVMSSPNLHRANHHHSLPSRDHRITAPQPVDHEKMRQLEYEKAHTLKLMLEKERRYVESLRSKLAKNKDPGTESIIQQDLLGAERRVQTLQQQLEQEAGPQVLQHTHQRTKSSPDNLSVNLTLSEATKRLIASESMSELHFAKSHGSIAWEMEPTTGGLTPPGTPPPPYLPGQNSPEHTYTTIPDDDLPLPSSEICDSPVKSGGFTIHKATQVQQPIISMEDEDMSDQEMTQAEDHGPFKNLSKLWTHQAHLAVFLNYVISNSDPASLLFYLVTDLYKEGNAKEMKKWAYEIHSSFLVPGAPLRLNNVDENIAREIDDDLLKQADKEEILRKIFRKARLKAKEELNEQLADFQAKRTAGLGTLFGPRDAELDESIHDKAKELKIIENILIPKLEPYLEDIERGIVDDKRFSTGAALGTVMSKVFGLRGPHFNSLLERCLTYVSKDKSLKTRLIGKTRKVTTRGHQCVAYQYYTVTYCNHCQLIIWGIGPQGYQCTNCGLNIHRHCVSVLEENCPGPMVKKERGNDRISKLMERIRPENNKRKPSSLSFAQGERNKRLLEEDPALAADNESGERSGSGREKRPDPVRESSEDQARAKQSASQDHDPLDPSAQAGDPPPPHGAKQHGRGSGVNRSESYKERIPPKRKREQRKTSDPNLSKSNNEVETDVQSFSFNPPPNSGSSSNSSLSTSLESPSNSTEAVACQQQQPWDSDIESDPVPPEWTASIPEEVREKMTEDERKRQEIINELFYTEKSHVRGLKVLERIFYRPMKEKEILNPEQLNLLFANLEEMVQIHSTFNNNMKTLRNENPVIGDISQLLLNMFDGTAGENFQKAAAMFCAQQHSSLELLKEKRKKDQKFHNFLNEAEMNSVCRRLQLKDILPTGWQRLTKYPLLLENLVKYSKGCDSEEVNRLQRALERSKEVLNHVDSAIKEAENHNRLLEIQRRLDTSSYDRTDHPTSTEFKNLDLTKHRLLYEGSLFLRIQNRQKLIDLHVLLLEDAIILLQKQDEKFVLKFYSQSLSPIIKISTVLVRPNAVDKKALFLVNTSHNEAQIYDFVANSNSDKRRWFKQISDAAEAYKTKEGKNKRVDVSSTEEPSDIADKSKEIEDVGESDLITQQGSPVLTSTPQPESPQPPAPSPRVSERVRNDEMLATYTEESSLVEPSEVIISQRDIHTAEPVLTPLEKLRRKDEIVREALFEKQVLVADILHIPREEFDAIADLAGEATTGDKDPSELILAAVQQASNLSSIVNEALRVSEEEVVSATVNPGHIPSVPAHKLYSIVNALNSHLSHLLNVMNERDEERERLRKELQKSRERIHAMHERHEHNGFLEQESSQSENVQPPLSSETLQDTSTGERENSPEEEGGDESSQPLP
ncbi:rho guanine nucleotide exchange factor 12 isoform X2 [Halyomorpha halys]|uniref:rho guanine nucleotide exchange factor 12 isoform X2 n=1 Tax=Halyomorpha halys TaxID=286706 RepID=UPI0006D512F4